MSTVNGSMVRGVAVFVALIAVAMLGACASTKFPVDRSEPVGPWEMRFVLEPGPLSAEVFAALPPATEPGSPNYVYVLLDRFEHDQGPALNARCAEVDRVLAPKGYTHIHSFCTPAVALSGRGSLMYMAQPVCLNGVTAPSLAPALWRAGIECGMTSSMELFLPLRVVPMAKDVTRGLVPEWWWESMEVLDSTGWHGPRRSSYRYHIEGFPPQ